MKKKSLPLFLGLLSLASFPALAGERDLLFTTGCEATSNLARISFVGDILIHKALYLEVANGTKHFSQIWKRTDPLIQKADFSVGNLEGPAALGIDSRGKDHGDIGFVYDGSVYSGTNLVFNYHPRIMSDLKNSGYDLIQTANNHAMDRFSIGVDKTLDAAAAAGLMTTGSIKSGSTNSSFYKITKINGINVAFLSCTENTNGVPDNDGQILLCLKEKTVAMVRELNARDDVDAVIVLPHWGVEYSNRQHEYQTDWARRYLDAGASAVIGSHPHVLQPWAKYITKDRRETLIIYSLGNFVAGQASLPRKTGTIAYVGFSKVNSGKARIHGIGYTPTYREGAEIFPIGKNHNTEILNHVASMYGTKSRIEPDGDIVKTLCAK